MARHGSVSITLDAETSQWYFALTPARRQIVDQRLRELARDPDRAPVRFSSPHGRTVYSALAVVGDGEVWAYRMDFIVDEVMQERANVPAIAVLNARALSYRR